MLVNTVPLLLGAAGFILYVASRAAVDALGPYERPSSERIALGHWIPIALTAVLSSSAGYSEIGIGIVFSSSVALLSLCLGVIILLAHGNIGAPPWARAWPLVVPAAMLPLMAGFGGSLTWIHASMMTVLGVLIALVWFSPERSSAQSADQPQARASWVQLGVAIALAGVGGCLAYLSILAAVERVPVVSTGLVAATIISPLLVLPVLGTASIAVNQLRGPEFVSAIVAIVLLNLCILLPAVVATSHVREIALAVLNGASNWDSIKPHLRPLPFPLAVWRIDTVLLIVLGLMLAPVSFGRWVLGRLEGVTLLVTYVAYLVMSMLLGTRG